MVTVVEMLAQAHANLARQGWTNEPSKLRGEGPRCVGLALADVIWGNCPHLMSVDNTPRKFLVAAIRERAPELIKNKNIIIKWNDHYCAGLDEALAVLKRAQELAENDRDQSGAALGGDRQDDRAGAHADLEHGGQPKPALG